MRKFLALFLLGILFFSLTSFVSAAFDFNGGSTSSGCNIGVDPKITDITSVKDFVQEFSETENLFSGSCWYNHFLDVLIYFVVPIFFFFVILFAVLNEIELFNRGIRIALAALLAIMAIPAGVLSGLIVLMANIGGAISLIFFFVIVFVLGLSTWYRRKSRDFGFFMGNRFLTILVVHAPLIIVMILVGIWLGGLSIGSGYLFSFALGTRIISSILLVAVIFGLALVLGLFNRSIRENWIGYAVSGAISLGLFALFLLKIAGNEAAQSSAMGAFIGLILGIGYSLVEWGRVYGSGLEAIDKEFYDELEGLAARVEKLERKKEHLQNQLEGAEGERANLIGQEIDRINAEIDSIVRSIRSRSRKAFGAFHKILHGNKR